MQFVIVTGMSGAGKSTVLKFLEDLGFFCVDNLPPLLIPKFAEICIRSGPDIENVALGIDIRGGALFNDLFKGLNEIESINYTILFLEADNNVLLNRYKETRRSHPISKGGSISSGIEMERGLLEEVKQKATYIVDTSFLNTRQLKEKINEIFFQNKSFDSLIINVMSFGFKHGIPNESDLVFDVRFIPNPFYLPDLKYYTGNDDAVRDYVLKWEVSVVFLQKLIEMVDFLIPNYISEGKNQLVISIGCTGGRHRSVTLANELFNSLLKKGRSVVIEHRDIDKDLKR